MEKLNKKKKLFRKAYIENLDFFNKEHLLRYFNFYSKFKYFFGILKTTFYELKTTFYEIKGDILRKILGIKTTH